ncbi:O-antigen ligase family protein [Atopomonas hussainii]|uniref:O-antigen ligase family protein n=1 Tax=Atopomonas hussainii TaxID=1429083 RepID=UPI00090034CC|nr:O-antigen ligase family protein [Atopomonas hussainii]
MLEQSAFFRAIVSWVFPIGLFALLTGMFWVGDRSLYHKVYYALLVLPVFIYSCARFSHVRRLLVEPLLVIFCCFAAYVMLTLLWSADAEASKVKHALYIFCLFVATGVLAVQQPHLLPRVVLAATGFAVVWALAYLLLYFVQADWGSRLSGAGALYNPLLTSHVYGFFAAVLMASLCVSKQYRLAQLCALLLVFGLLLLTGSRTPFVGLIAVLVSLLVMQGSVRLLLQVMGFGALSVLAVGVTWLYAPDLPLFDRGFSYRPAIWLDSWRQIQDAFWFGHGYSSDMEVVVKRPDGSDYFLADPHNLTLGVMYQTGLVGALLWLAMYAYAFVAAWRWRQHPWVVVTASVVMFGFVAGMTEGSSFLSRPKEHWFLIWLPLALHFAALLVARAQGSSAPSVMPQRG